MGMEEGMLTEDTAMMGMGAAPAAPAPVAGATVTPGATTGHGFIITVSGTTPHAEPAALLTDTMIKSLEAMSLATLPKDKKYYVAKAEIVTTTPLRANQTRMAELLRVFQAAEAARGLPAGQTGYVPAGTEGMMEDQAMLGQPGVPQPGQPQLGPNGQPLEDTRPYKDRMFPDEDVRDDSEFTIVFAVMLDPTPPAPTDPAATPPADPNATPPAPTAAAQ